MAQYESIPPHLAEKGQKAAIRTNLSARIQMYILTGAMMQLFANDVLGYSGIEISAILAVIPLVAFLRFPFLKKIQAIGYVKTLIISDFVKIAAVLVLFIIPASKLTYPLYSGLLVAVSLSDQLGGGTVWQPLLRDITTKSNRGAFFSRMRFIFTMIAMVFTAVIPFLIKEEISEGQYKTLLIVVLLGISNHLFWVRKIPELKKEPPVKNKADKGSHSSFLHTLRHSELLRKPLLIFFCFQFSLFPIIVLYLRQMLNIPSDIISIYTFLTIAGSAISLIIWGRIADAIGFKPMLVGLFIISIALSPLYLLISPLSDNWQGFVLAERHEQISLIVLFGTGLIYGAVQAGAGIALTSIQHVHTTKNDSLSAMSIFSAVIVLITAGQSLFNGFYLDKVAIPFGQIAFLNGLLHVDFIKLYLIFGAGFFQILGIIILRGVPNIRAFYGIIDFFSALRGGSLRSMLLSRNIYHGSENKRSETVQQLGTAVGPLRDDPLMAMLSDPSYDVKVQAIRALAGSPGAVNILLKLLKDSQYRSVHDHVTWAIGELKMAEAEPVLLERLSTETSDRIQAMIARALAKIGSRRSQKQLLSLFQSSPADAQHLRASICIALIQLNHYESVGIILPFLREMTARIERYELLNNLCVWYGLPNRWLIEYTDGNSNRGALVAFIERQSSSWRRKRGEICQAVINRDREFIQQKIGTFSSETAHQSLVKALQHEVQNSTEWEPVVLLAAACLIFR